MYDYWILFFIVVLIAATIWVCIKPPVVFVIHIRDGAASATRGKVTSVFLSTIERLCRENEVTSGEVRGIPRGRRISLRFSSTLPSGFCQPLRNWWAQSGWSAAAAPACRANRCG